MSANIMPFCFNGNDVRAIVRNEQPWFIAQDICVCLGFKNASDATKYLDDDETALISNPSGVGGSKATIVSESGLYHLIFKSRKPEAKKFRKWVTGEVLPSIRKTGSYSTEQQNQLAHWQSDIAEVASLADGIIAQAETSEQEKWKLVDRLFCKLFGQGIELIGGKKEVVYTQGVHDIYVLLHFDGGGNVVRIDAGKIKRFIQTCCVVGGKCACSHNALYQTFTIWWQAYTGIPAPPPEVFDRSLEYQTIEFIGEPWYLGVAPRQTAVAELGEFPRVPCQP